MLSLLIAMMLGSLRAETLEVKTLIASRGAQKALVLVESNAGFTFLKCPFIADTAEGTIETSGRDLWRKCRALGRTVASGEDVERVFVEFGTQLSAFIEAANRHRHRHLGVTLAKNVAAGLPVGVGAGLIRALVHKAHAAQFDLHSNVQFGLVIWILSSSARELVDMINILGSRSADPSARFMAAHVADLPVGRTVVLENGPGATLGFDIIVQKMQSALRQAPGITVVAE